MTSPSSSSSDVARHQLARRLDRAVGVLDDPATPMVVIDLDAFDANAADLVRRAGGKPIRVASKSLRVPALVERALARRRASPGSSPTPCARRSGSSVRGSPTTS